MPPLLKDDIPMKKLTIAEFDALPMDEQSTYELIDNIVMMTPRPSLPHQNIMSGFNFYLRSFLKGKTCRAMSEIEIRLNKDILVPDISVICDTNQFNNSRYDGAPTLVIEILSPSTARNDLFVKLNKYQLAGVKEYWIVNAKLKGVTIHNFEKETVTDFSIDDTLTSLVFEGLSIPLNDIFQ